MFETANARPIERDMDHILSQPLCDDLWREICKILSPEQEEEFIRRLHMIEFVAFNNGYNEGAVDVHEGEAKVEKTKNGYTIKGRYE